MDQAIITEERQQLRGRPRLHLDAVLEGIRTGECKDSDTGLSSLVVQPGANLREVLADF